MINEPIEENFSEDYEIKAKEASDEILKRLKNFIASKENILIFSKSKSKPNIRNLLENNEWILLLTHWIFFSLLSLILATSSVKISYLIVIISLGFILLLALILDILIYSQIWNLIKEIGTKAIDRAAHYPLRHYYQIIEELGATFNQECLNREEIRFRLAINKIIKSLNMLKQSTLLISIFAVVLGVIILGSPDEDTEIKYLYGTIVGLSGVTFVTKAILDMFYEWLFQTEIDVYNKCLLILQKAQDIAKEEELDEQRAYDEAKALNEEVIPFEQAILEIEQNR